MTKLALQRKALKNYIPNGIGVALTDKLVEEDGYFDGDTLALFIWREVGAAEGNSDEAARMMWRAVDELTRIAEAL